MAEARVELVNDQIEVQFQVTASLMALIANCHRDPKKGQSFKPEDFYRPRKKGRPGKERRESIPVTKDVSIFRTVFIDHKLPDAKHEPCPRK